MITIDTMRKEALINRRQWEAAEWFRGLAQRSPPWHRIKHVCNDIAELNAQHRVDPWLILNRCVVSRVTVERRDLVIGVLRETLNAVHRTRQHERKRPH